MSFPARTDNSKPPGTVPSQGEVKFEPIPNFTQLKLGHRENGLTVRATDIASLKEGKPFSLTTHKWVTDELLCADTINLAHYRQDIIMQLHSKAHFDNCDFENGLNYISELKGLAEQAVNDNNVNDALSYLGRAIHALQDFYAHSEYVELMEKKHPHNFTDVPILRLWTDHGRQTVLSMSAIEDIEKRLNSGYVWWGWPKYCEESIASHGEMAKDSHSMKNGAKDVSASWGGISRYQAARELASRETIDFLKSTVGKWDLLKKQCGDGVPFLNIMDLRKPRKHEKN